jgi:DNA-binding FadR family transcriptional regulator
MSQDLEYLILEKIERFEDGIGSGNLYLYLLEQKIRLSEATVGRHLCRLDHRKFTAKVGNRGRVLTAAGRRHLQELRHKEGLRNWAEQALKEIKPSTQSDYLQALHALRCLEGQLARLAAEQASPEQVAVMREILEDQHKHLESLSRGRDQGLGFHVLLERAAANKYLQMAVDMIWSSNRAIKDLWADADVVTGHSSYPDHLRILRGIAARDPAQAERAMHSHYDVFIEGVKRHFIANATVSLAASRAQGPEAPPELALAQGRPHKRVEE